MKDWITTKSVPCQEEYAEPLYYADAQEFKTESTYLKVWERPNNSWYWLAIVTLGAIWFESSGICPTEHTAKECANSIALITKQGASQ